MHAKPYVATVPARQTSYSKSTLTAGTSPFDVTVATALLSHPDTLKDPSYAMNKIIGTKRAKYHGRLADVINLLVFALDSSGGFHSSASHLVKRIAGRLALAKNISKAEAEQRI